MITGDPDPGHVGDGVRIKRASAILGVPMSTLRSWERRYGLPATKRSAGGHRRYSDTALNELRLMRDEVGHGKPASTAARRVRQMLDPTEPGAARIGQLLTASRRRDALSIVALLDVAEREVGLDATLDEVLMPAMRQIGTWWENGRCDIEQESLTTAVVRGWLARQQILAPVSDGRAPVLLACGARDHHTIGLEAFAVLLGRRHRATRVLPTGTSTEAMLAAVVSTGAGAVAVVSHLRSHRHAAVGALSALAATGCPTYYAGNAFLFPGTRVAVPGTYLGETLAGAADLVNADLERTSPLGAA